MKRPLLGGERIHVADECTLRRHLAGEATRRTICAPYSSLIFPLGATMYTPLGLSASFSPGKANTPLAVGRITPYVALDLSPRIKGTELTRSTALPISALTGRSS